MIQTFNILGRPKMAVVVRYLLKRSRSLICRLRILGEEDEEDDGSVELA